jgi:hypothetical protein
MSNEDHQTPIEADDQTEASEGRTEARRKFLKKAGQVAVTTSAVTMLLSAGAKQSQAIVIYKVCDGDGFQDGTDGGEDGDPCPF